MEKVSIEQNLIKRILIVDEFREEGGTSEKIIDYSRT